MAETNTVMGWGGCLITVGGTDVGIVKQNSTSLSVSEGDTLEAKDSFGATVAREQQEGTMTITTTIIEPSAAFYTSLGITNGNKIVTLVVPGSKEVKITPKNKGAWGITAPNCRVAIQPNFGNDTGNELTLSITVNKTSGADGGDYFFERFQTTTNIIDQSGTTEAGS